MKKIFIVKGISNVGKTTKVNQIADWIITTYGAANTIGLNTSKLENDTLGVLTIGKLTIGISSSGDDLRQVKKIEKLKVIDGDYPDIIICTCRTKGGGYQYLKSNFNYHHGWLKTYINVEAYNENDTISRNNRDSRVLDELKTWLIGLPKL